jgi:glutamate/tyrosine decarboxylase-like PLP-dependent enzyme
VQRSECSENAEKQAVQPYWQQTMRLFLRPWHNGIVDDDVPPSGRRIASALVCKPEEMMKEMKTRSADLIEEALDTAEERSRNYLRGVGKQRVYPGEAELAALARFREPFPELPCEATGIIRLLDEIGSPATVATTGGRYFGFVIGGTLPAALAASRLVNTWDQNPALRVMSPVVAEIEEIVLSWVRSILGSPDDCEGAIVTGATMANFTALCAARHALVARNGWNVEDNGMFGAPPVDVMVGEEVHASLLKALSLAGFGKERVTRIPTDKQGRMRLDRLPKPQRNALICIQAGNVNTGAFDPAGEICTWAHENEAWVHVDGAFGLWAAASPKYRDLVSGFEQADSWATDAHKWPNVNYDCGIALVRDGAALRAAMTVSAAYLQSGSRRDPANQTPDASRRARAVELWAGLKSLGRQGLAELIERTCTHAKRFATELREAGYEILNEVVINQVLVSFGQAKMTREIIRRVQEDGTCWCGGTVWQGKTAMRISVSSWATSEEDVQMSLAAIIRIAREVRGGA